jgi:hypothetical protein
MFVTKVEVVPSALLHRTMIFSANILHKPMFSQKKAKKLFSHLYWNNTFDLLWNATKLKIIINYQITYLFIEMGLLIV